MEPGVMTDEDRAFFEREMKLGEEYAQHIGRWVAVADQHVIAVADTVEELFEVLGERKYEHIQKVTEPGVAYYL